MKRKTSTLVMNAIVASLYVVVTIIISPIGFGPIQFRVSELFNHLIIFNKKYFYGIVLGVFIANLLLSTMKVYDLTFGVAHSIISLFITIFLCKFVKNIYARLLTNTLVFTSMMWIIAISLNLAIEAPFLITYVTLAISELIILLIAIPVVTSLNKKINFKTLIK